GHESTAPAAVIPPLDALQREGERAENVSPLWPKLTNPQADAPAAVPEADVHSPQTYVEPVLEPTAEQTETPTDFAGGTSGVFPQRAEPLAPNVAIDIEQGLTAELEDELIGALRQSVDEEVGKASPGAEAVEIAAAADAFADITEEAEPYGVRTPANAETPVREEEFHWKEEPAAPQPPAEPAVSFRDPDLTRYPVATGGPSANADVAAATPVAPVRHPSERQENVRRPAIDENDFFAALNTQNTADVADGGAAHVPGERDNPAGIDALFADLDFPEREKRAPIAVEPEAPEHDPAVTADDIDDMAWPEAANAVPDVEDRDEDTPPPPEGYDLDAVARAMQESDPSLSGAGVLPPHSDTEKVAAEQSAGGSRRGLYVALGVVAVAALGGAGFFLYDGSSVQVPSGPPPVISGLQEPLKIFPEQSQSNSAGQGSTKIADRLTGQSAPERLNIQETPQPVELPPAPASSDGSSELAPGTPKQVRTVIVRPDGTIVSGDNAPVISTPTTAETPAPQAPEITAPPASVETPQIAAAETENAVPVETQPIVVAPQPETTTTTETAAVQPQVQEAPTPAPVEPAAPAVPEIVTQTEAPVQAEVETPAPAAPVPTVVPRKKPQAPVQVAAAPAAQPAPAAQAAPAASQQQDGPLNLSNTANAPAPAATSTSGSIPSGTYIVQVTSQRSAAAASNAYAGLQRQYPGVLGNRNAVIVSADLGDRGVFYRARIPTGSRSEANTLCESLKGAGGDCFVRRQP
ncbi:MAG: SPOR domain-containing protein, partial [Pseudomonadota bacterium]